MHNHKVLNDSISVVEDHEIEPLVSLQKPIHNPIGRKCLYLDQSKAKYTVISQAVMNKHMIQIITESI